MLPSLDRLFKRIESQRVVVMEELKREAVEDVTWKPGPESWSLTEVVEHLVIAEERSLRGLEKERPADLGSRFGASLRIRLLTLLAPLPIRVKAPSKGLLPTGIPELPELATRWGEARCRLAGVLDAVTPETLGERRWKHPVAGWLDTHEWLSFILAHVDHHRAQMRRIRKSREAAMAGAKAAP
ncbi:MAG TPA: DinB family protein [Gemmatimonadales bacterium]